jgi:hypothetical protein
MGTSYFGVAALMEAARQFLKSGSRDADRD